MNKTLLILILFLFFVGKISAEIKLPKIFNDNMVLQQGMRVPVWGWADPGEKIIATLGGHQAETITRDDGRWKLFIGPLDAGGPFELNLSAKNIVIFKNVLVGEVWVCSGQSNMAMEVQSCMNAREETEWADYPSIRYFQVARTKAPEPLEDVFLTDNPKAYWLNKWNVCSPETVGNLTGVGYFFGRNLHKKLDVPVGLISASWGSTTAEAWTPKEALESDTELMSVLLDWPGYNNDEEWLKSEYDSFVKEVKKAQREGKELPLYFNQPSVLYNGILAPVVQYGIRGVIWYQGESNAYRARQYRKLFPAMIQQWRMNWGQGDFPFLYVQLANYSFEPQVFPGLREAQLMTLSLPETAMAVTIDIGDSTDIHPKNKQEVGRRLALAARKVAYDEDIIYSGPLFKYMYVSDGKCKLSFNQIGDGLAIKGGESLSGFVIAGVDRHFVQANAVLDNDQVVV
jgi:sialate O-acetylesterase